MKQVAGNMKHKRGFTLVELLVAMGIFVIVITIVSSIFIRNLRTQQSIVALIAANDSASLALEQMAREMRTGKSFYGGNPQAVPLSEISFINAHNESVNYKLEGQAIKRQVDTGDFYPITAESVKVENLKFIVDGNTFSPPDHKPTKITIILSVRPKGGNIEAAVTNLQTTVTSRQGDK